MELYLDLYGNALVRDKTQSYLEEVTKELIQLVTEDSKCTSPIQDLVNFETLKFKERDEVEDIFSSYLAKHKFDIEQLRDQRVRALLKDRYDHKQNMTDWDYNFGIKDYSKTVNQREYKQWRLTGIFHETRLDSGKVANRTMSSYVSGKTVSITNINF